MNHRAVVIAGGNSVQLAKKVAKRLRASFTPLHVSRFPDGESSVRIQVNVEGKAVIIINALYPQANEALMDTALAIDAAKHAGALSVNVVVPYLAYMRQDKVFNRGESLSAGVMARVLDDADRVIAVDPHLHRIHQLGDLFKTRAESMTANGALASYVQKHYRNSIIVGPDAESYQWARAIAEQVGLQSAILTKTRFSSTRVAVKLHGHVSIKGRHVVIVDDVLSTGHTVAEAAKLARRLGAKRVSCVTVHGLYVDDAVRLLKRAGVKDIVCTNTTTSKFAKIDVSELIADAL